MQETKHTPGPWTVMDLPHVSGDLWLAIGHMDGDVERGPVADILGEKTFLPVADLKYLPVSEAEQRANATLIAAAPAILDALRESMQKRHDYGREIVMLTYSPFSDWEQNSSHTEPIEACESPGCRKSRAAIAAATGATR